MATLFPAVLHLLKKDYTWHGFWMKTSYALTLAGVLLRIEMPMLIISGVDAEISCMTAAREV